MSFLESQEGTGLKISSNAGMWLSHSFNILKTIPLYRITTKCRTNTHGILVEPGMFVKVVSKSLPVFADGGSAVAAAFMRVYEIDLKRAGALNTMYLSCERIG